MADMLEEGTVVVERATGKEWTIVSIGASVAYEECPHYSGYSYGLEDGQGNTKTISEDAIDTDTMPGLRFFVRPTPS